MDHRVKALQGMRDDFFAKAAASGALPPSIAGEEVKVTDGQ